MKKVPELPTIATLFGVMFLASVDNQLLIPILPTIASDLSVSMEGLSRLFSAYALAAALFNLIVGPLTDRFGRLVFLRIGIGTFWILALATYFSTGYWQLLGLRTMTGLAGATLSTCTAALVGDYFPYRRRGRVMGLVLSAYFLALILGVPGGAWITEHWNWRSVFLVVSFLAFALLLQTGRLPRTIGERQPRSVMGTMSAYPRFLSRRLTLGALSCSCAISGATLSFLTFISDHLNRSYGATPIQVSYLFIISGFGAIAGSGVSGWMSDRFGKRRVFLAANSLLVIPLLLVDRLPLDVVLVLVFLGISFLVASRQTALQTIQTELVGMKERGAFLGLRNGMSQLGISVSVFLSGALYANQGYRAVLIFSASLTLVASLVAFFFVTEPKRTPASELG